MSGARHALLKNTLWRCSLQFDTLDEGLVAGRERPTGSRGRPDAEDFAPRWRAILWGRRWVSLSAAPKALRPVGKLSRSASPVSDGTR